MIARGPTLAIPVTWFTRSLDILVEPVLRDRHRTRLDPLDPGFRLLELALRHLKYHVGLHVAIERGPAQIGRADQHQGLPLGSPPNDRLGVKACDLVGDHEIRLPPSWEPFQDLS